MSPRYLLASFSSTLAGLTSVRFVVRWHRGESAAHDARGHSDDYTATTQGYGGRSIGAVVSIAFQLERTSSPYLMESAAARADASSRGSEECTTSFVSAMSFWKSPVGPRMFR